MVVCSIVSWHLTSLGAVTQRILCVVSLKPYQTLTQPWFREVLISLQHIWKKCLHFRTVLLLSFAYCNSNTKEKKRTSEQTAPHTRSTYGERFSFMWNDPSIHIYSYIFRFVLPPIASLCWAYTLRLECITHIALPACFYTNANESLLCIYAPLYTYLFGIKCMWLVRFCCTQMHMRCGRINSNKKNVGCRILQTYCSVKWLQAQNTHSENIYMEFISFSVDTGKINYKKKIVCLVPLLFA